MKTSKIILVNFLAVLLMLICIKSDVALITLALVIISFFSLALILRKSLFFKNYFTSKYNLFTTKIQKEMYFEISKELLFEKIIEVIDSSEFKISEINKEKFQLLAISKVTLKSWGENIYIHFETKGKKTIMHFCSVTLFQMHSWGKNEENYQNLLNEIENSFTI